MFTALRRLVFATAGFAAGGILCVLPAQAAPIFTTTSVSPSAISPNGDNVQDLTVISYQVAVDSADVRVLLAVPGGSVVDTLEAFTRRGLGPHSLAFDGTGASGPVPDGSYEIRIFGVGSGGQGTESLALPLEIDRTAPVISQWTLSLGVSSVVHNGEILSMQACVEGGFDSIAVDLSSVDSNFDVSRVNENLLPPPCRLYTYTISAGNTHPDAAELPAVVRVRDRAGNASSATFLLCLSNHPPAVSQAASLQNESPFFQNGDEIQTLVGFTSSSTLSVTGDFSAIDSRFDADSVLVTPESGNLYRIRYRLSAANTRPDGDYPIRLLAYDRACGVAVDSSLTVSLDNAGINSSLVESFVADPTAFSPSGNGTKQVGLHFTVLEDTLIVSISTLAVYRNQASTSTDTLNVPIQLSRTFTRGVHTVLWDGSFGSQFPASRLIDQNLTVVLRATSVALDRQRSLFTGLEVDNISPILRAFPLPGQVEARNGQLLNLPLTYDRAGYRLTADLRAVDSNFNPQASTVVVADSSGGKYGIFYPVSSTNTALDAGALDVPVTAVDQAGNTATVTNVVKVCLDNLPPHLASAVLQENQGPFRNGDRIHIVTHWDSEPQQSALDVTADFSGVDDRYNAVTRPALVTALGGGNFDISYTLAGNNAISGTNLPILVTGRDQAGSGCGSTTVVAVRVTVDSKSGPAPTFDVSSLVVNASPATVSGTAVDADSVEILRGGTVVDSFAVSPLNHRFSGAVAVVSGKNEITARGFDRAGNTSPASRVLEVFLVQGTLLTIPPAFRPGSEFFVALSQPADKVTVHIYSLEGVEIQRLESQTPGDLFHIPWDGKDKDGTLTSSGPCLAAVDVEAGGNVRERLHQAFIFSRRSGATP